MPPGWSDWHARGRLLHVQDVGLHDQRQRPLPHVRPDVRREPAALPDRRATRRRRRRSSSARPPARRAVLPVAELPRAAPRGARDPAAARASWCAPRRAIAGALRERAAGACRELQRARHVATSRASSAGTHPLTGRDIAAISVTPRARRAALLAVDDGGGARRRRRCAARRARQHLHHLHLRQRLHAGRAPRPLGKMLPYEPVDPGAAADQRGPGIPAGACPGSWSANIDLAPTILELGRRDRREDRGRPLPDAVRATTRRCARSRAILHETGGQKYVGPAEQDERTNVRRPMKRVLTYQAIRTSRLALRALARRVARALRPTERPRRASLPARGPAS